jgi:single-stranded DNA-binding protein
MNNLSITGKITRSTYKGADEMGGKNALLKLSVVVSSGERKRDGDEYSPSYFIDVPIWGNFGTALNERATVGSMVAVSGTLCVPTVYAPENGEPKVNLSFDKVAEVTIFNTEGATPKQEEPKATTTKSKKKDRVENADDDDDDGLPF